MPRTKAATLPRILAELLAEADQRGESSTKRLEGGATLKARSRLVAAGTLQHRKRQLIIGRRGVAPGDGEIVIFRRDGKIPPHAAEAQYLAGAWHYTAITWDEIAVALPLDDLPEGC